MKFPELPDEIIEQTRQVYNQSEGQQWVFGDHLVGILDEIGPLYAKMVDSDAPDMAYHRARAHIIRTLAKRIGCDTTTLRDREMMARFYPVSTRKEYDMLTYHQLRACKAGGKEWQVYADWARDNLPAPVALIRRMVRGDGNDEPPWVGRWGRIVDLAQMIIEDHQAPQKVREAARAILRSGISV